MLIVTKEGQMEDLKLSLGKNLVLRLFINDIEPSYMSKPDDFEEVDGDIYIPEELKAENWLFSFITIKTKNKPDKDIPVAEYPEVKFYFSDIGFNVYGYYVTDSGTVRWAERFENGPYGILRRGDVVFVTLKVEKKVK